MPNSKFQLELSPGARLQEDRRVRAAYEAAVPDPQRPMGRSRGTGDWQVFRGGRSILEQARHLEENYDIVQGGIAALCANVLGPQGIQVEPQPRRKDGTIHEDLAATLRQLWTDFTKRPEVTWEMDWAGVCHLALRRQFVDGEIFTQMISGRKTTLDHGTFIPFSLELIESEMIPFGHNSADPIIVMGVEKNRWGRPVRYWVHRLSEMDLMPVAYSGYNTGDLRPIDAANMLHLKHAIRVRQTRGVSMLAAAIPRLDRLRDYDDAEQVAASMAASWTGAIKTANPDPLANSPNPVDRDLELRKGEFLQLGLDESIDVVDFKRPNPNLAPFRDAQLRAASGAMGVTYSALSRNYDGTYSSQRQELVEGFGLYGAITERFIWRVAAPVYERAVQTAEEYGLFALPKDVDRNTVADAMYQGGRMPWIEPVKEAKAWEILERNGYASGPEICRMRGVNPDDVIAQQELWLEKRRKILQSQLDMLNSAQQQRPRSKDSRDA